MNWPAILTLVGTLAVVWLTLKLVMWLVFNLLFRAIIGTAFGAYDAAQAKRKFRRTVGRHVVRRALMHIKEQSRD